MRIAEVKLFLIICIITTGLSAFSQEANDTVQDAGIIIDSLRMSGLIYSDAYKKPEIVLSTDQAVKFLRERYQPHFWNDTKDPLRVAIGQLVFEASHQPYDSSELLLRRYPYDSLRISWDKFYIWEPLRFKIPFVSTPVFSSPAVTPGSSDTLLADSVADTVIVSIPLGQDTITEPAVVVQDTIPESSAVAQDTIPDPVAALRDTVTYLMPVAGLKDTTILVIIDTLTEVSSGRESFPFRYMNYPYQADSIEVAVNSLLKYLEERDSSVINFTGRGGAVTPVWLNSKAGNMARYWLKNEFADSVTVWIGNPSRNTIGLYLEQGVNFKRPPKQENYSEARINVQQQDRSKLLEVQRIVLKKQLWKYRTEAAFALSQTALFNWVRGGEKSLSTLLDVTGYADYNNQDMKLSSNNFARIKLGFLKSGDNPVRKNQDIIETNSKLNHKAFGKFDFSAILLIKTQIAYGKDYSTDPPDLVSKFFNPLTLMTGLGLDYKPNPQTSINFSPLSYKGTFVGDTLNIDQTKYGIAPDRKSKNEPGLSFMISHNWKPYKMISVTNRLQLFTNYINNPQNIDVDWEMIAVANLNWFTDVRLNTHLIFDDDTKTVVLDDNNNPVLMPDGSPLKTARIQFKEMIGLSLVFKF